MNKYLISYEYFNDEWCGVTQICVDPTILCSSKNKNICTYRMSYLTGIHNLYIIAILYVPILYVFVSCLLYKTCSETAESKRNRIQSRRYRCDRHILIKYNFTVNSFEKYKAYFDTAPKILILIITSHLSNFSKYFDKN